MAPDIDALLQQYFGFGEFRPGQREVISQLLGQGRALAVFPTGGGKSLCYQLPALALEGTTLVVSPLIALMKDQIDFLRSRGIAAARLDSSLSAAEAREVADGVRSGDLKLLYVSPERFNNERFRDMLSGTKPALFAVDEAHCISEWGHNFRPDYLKLARFAQELQVPRILALTATATPQVQESICEAFGIPAEAAVVTGFYRPNLNLCLTPVTSTQRPQLLLQRLQKRKPGATIIYVTLQKTAEWVADYLSAQGLQARAYHAGMEAETRHEVQEWWMAAPDHIVVATIAFGMGIDKADVRYVYHYNLPKGLENFAQEIGRAGRDGKPSIVETLACPDDASTLENFAYGDTPTPEGLHGLIEELLDSGTEFSIKEYDLSQRHDLRPLVLRTVLTYLELGGILQQGTPYYAGYEVRPLSGSLETIYEAFGEKAATFLRQVFSTARAGKTWWKIDPESSAKTLGCPREHIVRAMGKLEEKGVAEVRASDVRQRFTRIHEDEDADDIVEELVARFAHREEAEIRRIADVLGLIELDDCQSNALVSYFGEERAEPCGHCSWCKTQRAAQLPPPRYLTPMDKAVSGDALRQLQAEHPDALGAPRQAAHFLCGLSSPALTRAKLSRHAMFGVLEEYPFADVLRWCEGL